MPDLTPRPAAGEITRAILAHVLEVIAGAEAELGRLDAAAGDGDHGAGMHRGFRAAVAAVNGFTGSAGETLAHAGAAFADAAGGASGALVGMLITVTGQALPADAELDAPAVGRAIAAGLAAVQRLGKAKTGDKTLLDTLDPFVRVYTEAAASASIADAWLAALPAAAQGRDATAQMVSKRGRAARLGARSAGHVDPGAASMYYILHAAGETIAHLCGAADAPP